MSKVISVDNLSKFYRVGTIGDGIVKPLDILHAFGFMVMSSFLGTLVFNRVEATFMDTV